MGDANGDGQLESAVFRSWRAAADTPASAVTTPDRLLALRCVARVPTADWSVVRADVRLLICPLQLAWAALAALDRLDSQLRLNVLQSGFEVIYRAHARPDAGEFLQ